MKFASLLSSVNALVCEDLPFVIEKCLSRFEPLVAGIRPVKVPQLRWLRMLYNMGVPEEYLQRCDHLIAEREKMIRVAIGAEL